MSDRVIGIDEVGWGCIAGPLVVCACYIPFENWTALRERGFRDSKLVGNRVHVTKRETKTVYSDGKCQQLANWLNAPEQKGLASWAIVQVDCPTINAQSNPLDAKDEAFRRALLMLLSANEWPHDSVDVIVDGDRRIPTFPDTINQEALPCADTHILPASVASVMAKAYRDQQMLHLDQQFPQYGFVNHKGYGTEAHVKAVLDYGPIEGMYRTAYLRSRIKTYWSKLSPRDKSRKQLPKWAKELCNL